MGKVLELGSSCNIGVSHDLTGQVLGEISKGDVIGVAFGLGDIPNLKFYRNGELMDGSTVSRIRGEVWPAVSVDGGTKLLVVFRGSSFVHTPPGRNGELIP